MGGAIGGGQGSGGGVDPAFPSAPVNPMNLPASAIAPQMGMQVAAQPSLLNRIGTRAGQVQGYVNKFQPVINAIPGMQTQSQDRTQQQQRRYPVNFNVSPAPYVPPPGAGSNNNYGY